MNENEELDAYRKLLEELAEMSEHASLTGALGSGNRRAAKKYNAVLDRLVELQVVPQALCARLPEDASYDEIGVETRMLSSLLHRKKDKGKSREGGVLMRLAPFVAAEDLTLLVREHLKDGAALDMETLTQLAPFLERSLLGQMIRENLKAAVAPSPPPPPAAPSQSSTPFVYAELARAPDPTTRAVAPATEREEADTLLDLLKNPHLNNEERNDLLDRLREITLRAL